MVGEPVTPGRARLLARCAVLAALATLVVVLVAFGDGGLLVLLIGLLALAGGAMGAWWFLSRRGAVRVFGALLAVAAPVALLVGFTVAGLWTEALTAFLLWGVALACARSALRRPGRPARVHGTRAHRPRHPVILMNPKSGGGKVGKFHLVERAEELGARVILLRPGAGQDVAELARRAVAEGADLLGVAGGDGTQALVAQIAAEHDVPFLVVSAGTRNHFAMDLGLDRTDPSRCLDALTDGEELRIDLGTVAGRAFVNTVSFGVYADIVQRPEYRDAKAGTILDAMPDLLAGAGERLDAQADEARLSEQQALLISNNPYGSGDTLGTGRRARLDGGVLGVIAIRVENAAQAADLAVRGAQASGLNVLTARRVEITARTGSIPVAVDGEALTLPTPVVCDLRPRALRVLVPRDRPGTVAPTPALNWRDILDLALGRPSAAARDAGEMRAGDPAVREAAGEMRAADPAGTADPAAQRTGSTP
ncbi:diacylglycerol/lipid kinase family protein [Kitasatospora sp. NPDC004240]